MTANEVKDKIRQLSKYLHGNVTFGYGEDFEETKMVYLIDKAPRILYPLAKLKDGESIWSENVLLFITANSNNTNKERMITQKVFESNIGVIRKLIELLRKWDKDE